MKKKLIIILSIVITIGIISTSLFINLHAGTMDGIANESDYQPKPLVGDFNGDGKKETLIPTKSGLELISELYKFNNFPNFTSLNGWILNTATDKFIAAGDLNGDKKDDILVKNQWGIGLLTLNNDKLEAFYGAPSGTTLGGWRFSNSDEIKAVADFNGDGKKDLFISSSWGSGILIFNENKLMCITGNAYMSSLGGWIYQNSDKILSVGDFNGNQKEDILIQSSWGIGLIEYNGSQMSAYAGAGFYSSIGGWILTSTDIIETTGDFNGDKKKELLIYSNWGLGVIAYTDHLTCTMGSANFGSYDGWYLNTSTDKVQATLDMNSDGKDELLVVNNWGIGLLSLTDNKLALLSGKPSGTTFNAWKINTSSDIIAGHGEFGIYDQGEDILVFNQIGFGYISFGEGNFWGFGLVQLDVPQYTQMPYDMLCWATSASSAISYLLNDHTDRKLDIAKKRFGESNFNQPGTREDIIDAMQTYTKKRSYATYNYLQLSELTEDIFNKKPVISLIGYYDNLVGHSILISGYLGADYRAVSFMDPADGENYVIDYDYLVKNSSFEWYDSIRSNDLPPITATPRPSATVATPTPTPTPTLTPTPTPTPTPKPTPLVIEFKSSDLTSTQDSLNKENIKTGYLDNYHFNDMIPLVNGWVILGDTDNNTVYILNALTGKVEKSYQLSAAPRNLDYDAANGLIVATQNSANKLALINIENSDIKYIDISGSAIDVCFGGANKIFVASSLSQAWYDKQLGVIDIALSKEIASSQQISEDIGFIGFNKSNQQLMVGERGTSPSSLMSFSFDDTSKTFKLESSGDFGSNGQSLSISPDSKHVAFCCGGGNGQGYTITDFDSTNFKSPFGEWVTGAYPTSAAFSNDNKYLIATNRSDIKLFSVATHVLIKNVAAGTSLDFLKVDISKGGKIIYGSTGGRLNYYPFE